MLFIINEQNHFMYAIQKSRPTNKKSTVINLQSNLGLTKDESTTI